MCSSGSHVLYLVTGTRGEHHPACVEAMVACLGPKLGARNFIWATQVGGGGPDPGVILCGFSWEHQQEVEQLAHEQVPTWDAGITGSSFTRLTTMPLYFKDKLGKEKKATCAINRYNHRRFCNWKAHTHVQSRYTAHIPYQSVQFLVQGSHFLQMGDLEGAPVSSTGLATAGAWGKTAGNSGLHSCLTNKYAYKQHTHTHIRVTRKPL